MLQQLLLTFVVLWVVRLLWWRWRYDLHRIPSPPGLPLLGHTLQYIWGQPRFQSHIWVRANLRKLGYPPLLRVLGNDPTANSIMTHSTATAYVKAYRNTLASALTPSNLAKITPDVVSQVNRLMEIIEKEKTIRSLDFQDLCSKMAMDTLGALVFQLNFGGLDDSRQMHGLVAQTAAIGRDNFCHPLLRKYCEMFPWSREAKRRSQIIDAMKGEWDWIIDQLVKRKDPEDGSEPLWWVLKHLKDPETGKPVARKTLRAEVGLVATAGMAMTGHQLAWIASLLASHSETQEALKKELKQYGLDSREKEITYECIDTMPYLSAVVNEGMRLASSLTAGFARTVPKDMSILGFRVPKGTHIEAAGTIAVNFKSHWRDPDAFLPERWLRGENASSSYFLGFSTGPRDCVGRKLALLVMKLAIVRLMQQYSLELDGDMRDLLNNSFIAFVNRAKGGMWIRVADAAT